MREKDVMQALLGGKVVVLSYYPTQYGEEIADRRLRYEAGRYVVKEIACFSSADLDLGVCRCVSHDTWHEREVTRDAAMDMIRESLAKGDLIITDEEPRLWPARVF